MSGSTLMEKFDRMPKVSTDEMLANLVCSFGSLMRFQKYVNQKFLRKTQTQPIYQKRTSYGGFVTLAVFIATMVMIWYEIQHYLMLKPTYSFDIDSHVGGFMQINLDVVVATPCGRTYPYDVRFPCILTPSGVSIDLRDASGDTLHFSEDDIVKDPVDFNKERQRAQKRSLTQYFLKMLHSQYRNMKKIERKDKKIVAGGPRHRDSGFDFSDPMENAEEARACRVYGSILVKKVTGNLHISTFVPTFMAVNAHENGMGIDMSHIIHEFSFGDYFPNIAEPLDASLELTDDPAAAFQYFLSVVPTHFIQGRRVIKTNQYSVHDYKRNPEGSLTFPGLYFKYDIEPLTMKVTHKSVSLVAFIVRVCSVLGGLWICTDLAIRIFNRLMAVRLSWAHGISIDPASTSPKPSSHYEPPYFSGPLDPQSQTYSPYGSYGSSSANFVTHGPGETKYRPSSAF